MDRSIDATRIFRNTMIALAFTIAILLTVATNLAQAKRGGDDRNRSEFYGIVQERPANGLHGEWVIGGEIFVTDARTEFDQHEGDLAVGSCAKVHLRNDRVHEIDSEPMRDCR
jgi:hypothetical protein